MINILKGVSCHLLKKMPVFLSAFVPFLICFGTARANDTLSWVVYYSMTEQPHAFMPYDIVILDSEYPHRIDILQDSGKVVLCYLSIAEISKQREYFEEMQNYGMIVEENENWPGSYRIDLRNRKWAEKILYDIVPHAIRRGFHGLMVDTLDNAGHLERLDPRRYSGMRQAGIDLIKMIRYHYPEIKIMINRGYDVLQPMANEIDYVLAESVMTTYDFETATYRKLDKDVYQAQLKYLNDLRTQFPRVAIMTLDYWDPLETRVLREIYDQQIKNGFSPYVSTIGLDRVVPRPYQDD